jgi:hypothetical protein
MLVRSSALGTARVSEWVAVGERDPHADASGYEHDRL